MSSEETGTRRRDGLWLPLIILLGFGLRLSGLQWGQAYSYFGQGDAIQAYSVAVDFGRGEPRAQYIGQPNYNRQSKLPGPLWTVFCFLGLRLGGSIEGTVLAVILLNTLAIWVIHQLAERTLGRECALWAALLAATLPMAVYYSVGVYNPDVMALLGGLVYLALWQVVREARSRSIFWVIVVLFMMPQFHMSGLMLIPAVILVLAVAGARPNLPWLLGGLAAGICLYAPYLRGDSANGWQNTHGMFSGGGGGYTWDALKSLTIPLNLLVNWVPQWTRSAEQYRELGRACFGFFGLFLAVNLLSALVAGFLAVGAFAEIRRAAAGAWRRPREAFRKSPGIVFLALLLLGPVAFALVSGRPFHSRYCLILFPPVVCLAACAVRFWTGSARWHRPFMVGLVLTTCANIWFMPALYRHQGRRINDGMLFIPSFRQLANVYRQLKEHAGPGTRILVDDAAYLQALDPKDEAHRQAALLRIYVGVREREAAAASTNSPAGQVTYQLQATGVSNTTGSALAYQGHGITMVRARD